MVFRKNLSVRITLIRVKRILNRILLEENNNVNTGVNKAKVANPRSDDPGSIVNTKSQNPHKQRAGKVKKKKKNLIEYLNAYSLKKYRNVSLYPKILEEKPLSKFTKEEKKRLTRKGFRWYLYYDFLLPGTNKFKRQTPITAKMNRILSFNERFEFAHRLKEALERRLEQGYNPYEEEEQKEAYNLMEAIDFALSIKKKNVGYRTHESYRGSANKLKNWLKEKHYHHIELQDFNIKTARTFLSDIGKGKTPKTVNGYKGDLRALFEVLIQYEYLKENVFAKIKNRDVKPKANPTFTAKQFDKLFKEAKKNPPIYIYLSLIAYMFWRPKENCRLLVKDVDLENKTISVFETKETGLKIKRIPDLILEDLKDYIKDAEPEALLFTKTGPGFWDIEPDNRRSSMGREIRKLLDSLGFQNYDAYGLRHTGITRLYKNLKKKYPGQEDKVISLTSNITGHTSKAVYNYIHSKDIDLPDDYSDLLK